MGELRKKMGMSILRHINFFLVIILSFGLACSMQYAIYKRVIKTDFDNYMQYAVYFLYLLSILFLIIYYIKKSLSIPIMMYENGIILKRQKETIMYSEIPTFYFIPNSDKKAKFLVVEKPDSQKVVFSTSYVGEDFLEYFQKDYIAKNLDEFIERINNKENIKIGILGGKQLFMLKLFKGKNSIENLNFEDEIILTKAELKYKDKSYKWSDINIDYDMATSNINILDKDKETILSTYFSCVEKGIFSFKAMDYLIENYVEMEKELTYEEKELAKKKLIEDLTQDIKDNEILKYGKEVKQIEEAKQITQEKQVSSSYIDEDFDKNHENEDVFNLQDEEQANLNDDNQDNYEEYEIIDENSLEYEIFEDENCIDIGKVCTDDEEGINSDDDKEDEINQSLDDENTSISNEEGYFSKIKTKYKQFFKDKDDVDISDEDVETPIKLNKKDEN